MVIEGNCALGLFILYQTLHTALDHCLDHFKFNKMSFEIHIVTSCFITSKKHVIKLFLISNHQTQLKEQVKKFECPPWNPTVPLKSVPLIFFSVSLRNSVNLVI